MNEIIYFFNSINVYMCILRWKLEVDCKSVYIHINSLNFDLMNDVCLPSSAIRPPDCWSSILSTCTRTHCASDCYDSFRYGGRSTTWTLYTRHFLSIRERLGKSEPTQVYILRKNLDKVQQGDAMNLPTEKKTLQFDRPV